MADSSSSPPPVQNSASSALVSSPDQTSPATDIGQQLEGTWPNSTNLANSPSSADSNLANDQMISSVSPPLIFVEEKPPEPPAVAEPPKEEIPPPVSSAEVGQVTEAPPETTWPNSTKMANLSAETSAKADDSQIDTSNLTNPAPPTDQPVVLANSSPSSADSTPSSVDSPIPSIPAVTPSESVSSVSTELPPSPVSSLPTTASASAGSSPPNISSVTPASPPTEVTLVLSEATKPPEEKVDTNINLPGNQASQVHSEAPNITPTIDMEKTPDNIANFKPEPRESPQEAPLANQNINDYGQKSFGDLLFSENQISPNPSTSSIPSSPSIPSVSPSSSISFGDLIKDLKPEESVIPPLPIPPKPTVPSSSLLQNSSFSPPTTSPTISPIPNLPPIANISPISQIPSPDQLSIQRQKASQVRSQKKAKNLSKIVELARNAKSISNTDAQRLLHVSHSTATNYLTELTCKGLLKRQGTRGGTKYSL